MTSPEGAFYSSQDAETHHEEGRFYVWTDAELAAAIPDKADLAFAKDYYQAKQPNFEGKYHILRLRTLPANVKEKQSRVDEAIKAETAAKLADEEAGERARREKALYEKGQSKAEYDAAVAAKDAAHRDLVAKSQAVKAARTELAQAQAEAQTADVEQRKKIEPQRQKLFAARSKRDRPLLNTIALTGWSGQMIAGYAEAGRCLGERRYIETAAKAAAFVLAHQKTKDGRLLRTYGAAPGQAPKAAGNGYLEDYAFLVHGLLNLHDATRDNKWLDEAQALTDTMIRFHGDAKAGGFYFTASDHEKLFARNKDQYDGAQPSGNSMAARNLVRLWTATGDERYRKEAERTFRTFAGSLRSYGPGLVTMAHALDLYLQKNEAK